MASTVHLQIKQQYGSMHNQQQKTTTTTLFLKLTNHILFKQITHKNTSKTRDMNVTGKCVTLRLYYQYFI